jgi:hypothetical protein
VTARLGNVLYWAACLVAVLILAIGWINYPGVDTTGIEAARRSGLSDASIMQQQMAHPSAKPQQFEAASNAGYSPTEILDYLVKSHRSRLAGPPDLQQDPELVFVGAAALLAWLLGRALRYILAGT